MIGRDVSEYVVGPEWSIAATMAQIDKVGSRVVFVEEDGRLVGVVSDGDIRRAMLAGVGLKSLVSEVMNLNFVSAHVDVSPATMHAYFGRGISALPIVDEDDRLVEVLFEPARSMIPLAEPEITPREVQLVNECLRTGWISSQGRFVTEFEESFRTFVGAASAVAVSSGTTGLVLALKTFGIGPGDEVIVPDFTFGATANAVVQVGATPRIVDVERDSWCLDPTLTQRSISANTKAIIPVHLYGYPARMDELRKLAEINGIVMIEDCAEAIGAYDEHGHVGVSGDAAVFSFYANKTVTTGEGGMVLFKDPVTARAARKMISHGFDPARRYWHESWGTNFRLTNLQAAMGVAQMERIVSILERKEMIAKAYEELLLPLVRHGLELHADPDFGKHSHWLYTVLLPSNLDPDGVVSDMLGRGIECRRCFYPLHVQPAFESYVSDQEGFEHSVELAGRGISLPSWPGLRREDIEMIAGALEACIHSRRRALS